MPVSPPPTRRFLLTLILTSTLLATLFVTTFRAQPLGTRHPHNALPLTTPTTPIMPPLNDTLRADLGRASWKLLHTIAARFPTHPTPDERAPCRPGSTCSCGCIPAGSARGTSPRWWRASRRRCPGGTPRPGGPATCIMS
ncbi:sulfhydryl oxidase [Teratosphaeria destructans]|uniref:Sulfhydryl oxidase n=1 Tax=Teratosphaeria destructans TaxID=418781 RepID=A0A9W7SPE7_9PEZI|nr:sulfhydryl oxidase [Teratosphaeria destructans]